MRPDGEVLTRMRAEIPPLEAIGDASAAIEDALFVGAPATPSGAPLRDKRFADSFRLGAPDDSSPRRVAEPIAPRFLAAAASLALHAALLGALAWRVVLLPNATATVEVELVNESEAAEAPIAGPIPEAAPQSEPSPPTLEPLAAPEPIPTPIAMSAPPTTPTATPEPIPTPTATPEATPAPAVTPGPASASTPTPTVTRIAPSPQVEAPRKSLAQPRRTASVRPRAAAPPAAASDSAATTEGTGPSLSAARADYGALVVAQIRAHKFYPAAALEANESGNVGVLFVVASSGQIASVTITRSSGAATLDLAARTIIDAIELPPPPGGFYSGSTQLDFVAP